MSSYTKPKAKIASMQVSHSRLTCLDKLSSDDYEAVIKSLPPYLTELADNLSALYIRAKCYDSLCALFQQRYLLHQITRSPDDVAEFLRVVGADVNAQSFVREIVKRYGYVDRKERGFKIKRPKKETAK